MALDLLSSFLAPSALVIKDSESGSIQVRNLKVVRVHVKLASSAMKHMREDGSTIVDCRIIQPATINIEAFCPDEATVNQLNNLLNDRANFYSVSSKGVILNNMMVEANQIRQTPDVMSAAPVRIAFRQVISKNVKPLIVAQSSDSTLTDRGMALLGSTTQTVTGIYGKIKGFFG